MSLERLGSHVCSVGVDQDTYFVVDEQKTRDIAVQSTSSAEVKQMAITEIPGAMKKMGWKRSAKLMQRWFGSPAWQIPAGWKNGTEFPDGQYIPDEHCDDSIIKMSWLMEYSHARNAVSDLLRERAFSEAGLAQISRRLRRLGWDGEGSYSYGRKNIIGRPSMSARELEQSYQNNYITVSGNATTHVLFDTMDDVYGSLGTYVLKVAVTGNALKGLDGRRYVTAEYAGVYVKDFYDFTNDGSWDQPLGMWTPDGILIRSGSAMALVGGMNVYKSGKAIKVAFVRNSDFLKYKELTGQGGDFVIFSDVYWIKQSGYYPIPWD